MDSLSKKEIETIKQAQNGSIKAFNTIFYKYKNYIEKILVIYLQDEDEAHDLANVVFVKIYNNLEKFKNYNNFKGWITTLTKRTAIDYIRSVKKKMVSIDDTEQSIQLTNKELDNLYGPDMKEIYNDALNIINSLSKTSRTVCKLFYIYNLTIPQIQMKTGMPEGTIKSALCRSRNQIKNKLKLC